MHQGSALSPYLFALVMDELTKSNQKLLWCMIFADDIVLGDETRSRVNAKLYIKESTLKLNSKQIEIKPAESLLLLDQIQKILW